MDSVSLREDKSGFPRCCAGRVASKLFSNVFHEKVTHIMLDTDRSLSLEHEDVNPRDREERSHVIVVCPASVLPLWEGSSPKADMLDCSRQLTIENI